MPETIWIITKLHKGKPVGSWIWIAEKRHSVFVGWGARGAGELNWCAWAQHPLFAHVLKRPLRILNPKPWVSEVYSCQLLSWPQIVTCCVDQWEARIRDCYRMCPPMRWWGGEPTEGTVLQHHCLSLVTKGADGMRKRGVSPSNPWLFRIVFQWKMTSKLWQPVTVAEVSCHRGIPLLTSPGWALSCRDVPQPRLVELVVGEGDPAGGALLLNPPCLRPKIGRARCSAGKPSWCSIW